MSPCTNQNVLSLNPNAHDLIERFCSCSKANELLTGLGYWGTILIETGNFPHSKMKIISTPEVMVNGIWLKIPRESSNKSMAEVLGDLTYELSNVENQFVFISHKIDAYTGSINMNEYVKKSEQLFFKSVLYRDQLIINCKKEWEVDNDFFLNSVSLKPKTFQQYFWEANAICHTDSIKKRWIDEYQKKFCEINSQSFDCMAKKINFCDYTKMMKTLSKEERNPYNPGSPINKRFCKKFDTFSNEVKKKLLSVKTKVCSTKKNIKK